MTDPFRLLFPRRWFRLLRSGLFVLLLTGVPGLAAASRASADDALALAIDDAWLRPPVTATGAGAGFLVIRNESGLSDRLVGASSPAAARVELHTHEMDGAVMRMRKIDAIPVPAGGRAVLGPGGDHLMFFDFAATPALGASVPVTLRFERAGEIALVLAVRDRAAAGHGERDGRGGHEGGHQSGHEAREGAHGP